MAAGNEGEQNGHEPGSQVHEAENKDVTDWDADVDCLSCFRVLSVSQGSDVLHCPKVKEQEH